MINGRRLVRFSALDALRRWLEPLAAIDDFSDTRGLY
jgi:hypothetical protein